MLSYNSENSEEMVSLKKLIIDQLQNLAEKFESASQENVESHKDMKRRIVTIIEEFCTINFDKKVRETFIKYLVFPLFQFKLYLLLQIEMLLFFSWYL